MNSHVIGEVELDVSGLGVIMFSPYAVAHIAPGDDYLLRYSDERSVQQHIQRGDLVGFGTSSPGRYRLLVLAGYPSDVRLAHAAYRLRLGLVVRGGEVHFRDLFDLMQWSAVTPPQQVVAVADGIYHVTLCSDLPSSGRLGDNQTIEVYLAPLQCFPQLTTRGVPMLVQ